MNADKKKTVKKRANSSTLPSHLQHINKRAAGIDIGASSHFVAVPEDNEGPCVREFSSFTSDLHALCEWLSACQIETVAMESTGVYWIPLYELLDSKGFDVKLVDARHVKNVSGRKTDVLDCQWLQQLHTYGLLNGAFRPEESICVLRAYLRQKSMLIKEAATHIQHMQKALSQMNIQLTHVIRDIAGDTGMKIIRAIIAGEHDPKVLARHRHPRCKNPVDIIEKALTGNYRKEHIFALQQAVELFDIYQEKISACDNEIERCLFGFDSRIEIAEEVLSKRFKRQSCNKNAPFFNAKSHLQRMTGVDLTAIPGIDAQSALKIISEIGVDLSRWKSSKQFASWLGICPGNRVSGGKLLKGKSKRSKNKAAAVFRMAASTLHRSDSALGAFLRRLKARIGPGKAIAATAHKLATIVFNMLKQGQEYVETGQDYYEKQYRERLVKNLSLRAKKLGFELVNASPN